MDPLYAAILFQQWAEAHSWLAFWLVFWALVLGYSGLVLVFRLGRLTWRAIVVLARGWPPAHLDADGDWAPRQERPPLEREDIVRIGDRETVERWYRQPEPS